jgi:hypothetical protein
VLRRAARLRRNDPNPPLMLFNFEAPHGVWQYSTDVWLGMFREVWRRRRRRLGWVD